MQKYIAYYINSLELEQPGDCRVAPNCRLDCACKQHRLCAIRQRTTPQEIADELFAV